jgi:hypothetical protein
MVRALVWAPALLFLLSTQPQLVFLTLFHQDIILAGEISSSCQHGARRTLSQQRPQVLHRSGVRPRGSP